LIQPAAANDANPDTWQLDQASQKVNDLNLNLDLLWRLSEISQGPVIIEKQPEPVGGCQAILGALIHAADLAFHLGSLTKA
jgi:hypothetical protein